MIKSNNKLKMKMMIQRVKTICTELSQFKGKIMSTPLKN
jgi:hypothetical protein